MITAGGRWRPASLNKAQYQINNHSEIKIYSLTRKKAGT